VVKFSKPAVRVFLGECRLHAAARHHSEAGPADEG
jgi:hypothetical protein